MTTGGTWLDERRRARVREAADMARLSAAIEDSEEHEFFLRYAQAFWDGGHCLIEPSRAEIDRVEVIIQRDLADRREEIDRQVAQHEVEDGVYFNLTGAVMAPTPEWLAKHVTTRFVPKQPDDTVRVIETVRVVRTPIIARLWRSGKISDELARACLWYRMRHEQAGLEGRWSSSQWRGPDDIPAGGSKGGTGPMAMTEIEAEARQEFRLAHDALVPVKLRAFFDKIVLEDMPLRRAARFAKCRDERALKRFRTVAESLLTFCENSKISLPPLTDLARA